MLMSMLLKFFVVSMVLCHPKYLQGFDNVADLSDFENLKRGNLESAQGKPYKSADHCWSLARIESDKIIKDECGKTNAKVSDGVATKKDEQFGTVVSLSSTSDSLVMTSQQSRCISDPSHCAHGITLEFWLKFRTGECIISSGGYTKRLLGPGFILMYNSKIHRMQFLLSTESQLWSVQFNIKKFTWVHLMFVWNKTHGIAVYENGDILTKDQNAENVRYPSFLNKYKTLTVGDPDNFMRLRLGARFEMGHLAIWLRHLSFKEIRAKAFMTFVKETPTSKQCCMRKYSDPCFADGCFYDETRCNNMGQEYRCICPRIKENKTCNSAETGYQACYDLDHDCTVLATQPNYCKFYVKKMRKNCAKSCNFCSHTVGTSSNISNQDSNVTIVAMAVGVSSVLILLIAIAIVMARMSNKWRGEFVPRSKVNDSIVPDSNTQEMIAAAVDPAPRITDVPFQATRVKKNTRVNLRRAGQMTSWTR